MNAIRNAEFAADAAWLEADWGIYMPYATDYLPEEFRKNFDLAMDAQPTLVTNPSAGIPSWFTQYADPAVIRVLQAPNVGAQIIGEQRRGSWTDQTAWFQMIENTGEVSSYGDYNANGVSDINEQWESRQSYLFQTHVQYGDLEVERAGLARLNMVSEKNIAAAKTLDKFLDYTYHFGVSGLACYGILNDPSLSPAMTPTTKAAGGTKWVTNGQLTATAQEAYSDFQMLYQALATATFNAIDENANFTLVIPNSVSVVLTAVNQFGITFTKYLRESFPNVRIIKAPRYSTAAGNVVMLIAGEVNGQDVGYCAFNEKQRDHRLIADTSSFKQKKTSGTWGAIIRTPLAVSQLIGV